MQQKVERGQTPCRNYVKAFKVFKRYVKEIQDCRDEDIRRPIGEVDGHDIFLAGTRDDETQWKHQDGLVDYSAYHPRSLLLVSAEESVTMPINNEGEPWLHPYEQRPESIQGHEAYMTEIQLRRIVDRAANEKTGSKTDGDETMVKDGNIISKFSKQSMELGARVSASIKAKIGSVYDRNVGQDSVFARKRCTTDPHEIP